jgi:hypothetical protein
MVINDRQCFLKHLHDDRQVLRGFRVVAHSSFLLRSSFSLGWGRRDEFPAGNEGTTGMVPECPWTGATPQPIGKKSPADLGETLEGDLGHEPSERGVGGWGVRMVVLTIQQTLLSSEVR